MKQRILIVEDDEIFLRPLQRTVEIAGYEALVVSSGEEAVELLKNDDVDLMLTDKRLPGIDGVELVRRMKADHPDLAVVVMTAYGTIGSAVEAMRLGAEDYLVKPFDTAEVLMVLRRAIEFHELKAASRATLRRNQERFTLKNIVAQSRAMQDVFELLSSVAGLDTTVLIHGETGVGKELLARSLHFSGARRDKPFAAVNCAAIPEELFESELFARPPAGGPRRHAAPRRDRRDAARAPVQAPARHRGEACHLDRLGPARRDRRALHRDDEQGPPGRGGAWRLPARSLLPALGYAGAGAPAA
jgi:DNA-binding NtrC family response regulator